MIELTTDQISILGRPNFACAAIARRLNELGLYKVNKSAEDEQAAAIHFMLELHEKHGEKWNEEAVKILKP